MQQKYGYFNVMWFQCEKKYWTKRIEKQNERKEATDHND